MIVMVPALGIGWLIYWLWMKKLEQEEKNQPKEASAHLKKTRNEISDWAKKMATADSPAEQARKRRLEMEKKWEEEEKKRQQQENQNRDNQQ